MRRLIRLTVLLIVLTGLGAAGAAAQSLPEGVTQAMVDKGKEIYAKQGLCFACHGQEGKGLVGPSLADDVWLHSKGSFEDIVTQIVKGVPKEESKSGVPMPPKGGSSITDEEVRAVAAYVYSLSHKK